MVFTRRSRTAHWKRVWCGCGKVRGIRPSIPDRVGGTREKYETMWSHSLKKAKIVSAAEPRDPEPPRTRVEPNPPPPAVRLSVRSLRGPCCLACSSRVLVSPAPVRPEPHRLYSTYLSVLLGMLLLSLCAREMASKPVPREHPWSGRRRCWGYALVGLLAGAPWPRWLW